MEGLLKKLETKFLAKKTNVLDRSPMWFLACGEDDINARTDLPAEVRNALLSLRENGFAVLPGNVPRSLCDDLVAEFEAYCASRPDSGRYRDAHGLHSRLALFHYVSDNALKVATMQRTIEVVRAAFGVDFTIVGSLLFERGSTQDVHRDTPAFFTNPLNHFFGVWNALEDIQ
jgi:phytanoyl-CoA hydroxylase